jgi:hypothetical protein
MMRAVGSFGNSTERGGRWGDGEGRDGGFVREFLPRRATKEHQGEVGRGVQQSGVAFVRKWWGGTVLGLM